MYELRSREELVRALRANDIVLVEYYEPGNRDCDIMHESMKDMYKYADRDILFCWVNVKEHPEMMDDVNSLPAIRVYYRGKIIFEQYGVLSSVEMNSKVVRRSIREVFRRHDIAVRI